MATFGYIVLLVILLAFVVLVAIYIRLLLRARRINRLYKWEITSENIDNFEKEFECIRGKFSNKPRTRKRRKRKPRRLHHKKYKLTTT